MNQREAKQFFQIPHWTYSDRFIEETRKLRNLVANFERAVERLAKIGKTE